MIRFRFGKQILRVCFVVFLAGLVSLQAQESSMMQVGADSLSLQDCIDIALQNKADIQIAQQRVDIANAQVKSSWGNFLPSVSASSGGSVNMTGTGEQYVSGVDLQTTTRTTHRYSAGVSLNQTIFNAGQLRNNLKYSNLNYEQSQVGLNATREQVVLNVTNAYFDVLRARELVQVYRQTLESSEAQVELARERYNLGAVAQTDVLRSETTAGSDRINVLQQQNTLMSQKRNLNLAMGRDPNTPVALVDIEYYATEIPALEQAKEQAVENNKNLRQYRLDVDMARTNLAIAKSGYFPSLRASAGYDRSGTSIEDLYTNFDLNWSSSVRLSLSIPIFNNWQTQTQVQNQRSQLSIAEKNLADARLQVEMQVENLVEQLETYEEIIALNELNLKSAEEDLRLARERYNLGQATVLDVLNAQASLTNAQRTLVYVKYEAKTQEAQLQSVLGELINTTEPTE